MKRCYNCMEQYDETKYTVCPCCGHSEDEYQHEAIHLKPGTVLRDQYFVGRVLGYGGFGVTYVGWDGTLQCKVAIKEYMPSEFSTRMPGNATLTVFSGDKHEQFEDGMKKFLDEARHLAEFKREEGIVKVFDCFEENNTAYIVMEYLEGETLADFLKHAGTINERDAVDLLRPVMKSLQTLHAMKRVNPETGETVDAPLLHRDIAPDNIFITTKGESKLIDFGASRYATTTHSRSLTVIVKPGYSPEEQYRSRGDQGKYTDVYSLSATLYKMITGTTPPDAMERRAKYENQNKDILVPPHKLKKGISRGIEVAVLNAMNVEIDKRTPDIETFVQELDADPPAKRVYGKIKKVDLYDWPIWMKVTIPAIIIALLTYVVLIATGVIAMPRILPGSMSVPKGYIEVPDVIGMKKEKAESTITRAGLQAIQGMSVESDHVSPGIIVVQDPFGGYIVNENSEEEKVITLRYSYSLEVQVAENGVSKIPYVEGLEAEMAIELLKEAGLTVNDEIKYVFDETMQEGLVCGLQLANGERVSADTEVPEGTEVILLVSQGPEGFVIDNYVGQKYTPELEKLLAQKGLIVTRFDEESDEYEKGYIVSQSVAAGTEVKRRDTVKFGVVPDSYEKKVLVPDVYGMTEDGATAALKQAGFNVAVYDAQVYDEDVDERCVVKQSVAANTMERKKTEIVIFLNPKVEEYVISFDGNGGEVSGGSITVKKGMPYGSLPSATREGYAFEGWYTSRNGGSMVSESSMLASNSNHTLYAAWAPNVFTLTFDGNGGQVDESSRLVKKGKPYGSLPTGKRPGYDFTGWASSDGGSVDGSTIMGNSDVTIYAQWQQRPLSGWVTDSEVPEDSVVEEEKWVYKVTDWITSETPNVADYTVDESKTETHDASYWSDWSDWTKDYYEATAERERQEEVRQEYGGQRVTAYNMVEYNYMTTGGTRVYRSSGIGGNYSGYGLSSTYGEFHRDAVWPVEWLNAREVVAPGGFSSGQYSGRNDGGATGYADGGVIFFIVSTVYEDIYNTVPYYRYRNLVTAYNYTYHLFRVQEKESSSEVLPGEGISDIVHMIKYR